MSTRFSRTLSRFGAKTRRKNTVSVAIAALGIVGALAGARPAAAQLFVSSGTSIYKFNASGTASVFSSSSLLTNPRGITFDSSGNLYVANGSGNNIVKISADGSTATVIATNGSNGVTLTTPSDIVLGPDGNLYVSNAGSGTTGIRVLTTAGAPASSTSYPASGATASKTIRGLDFSGGGKLYITNQTDNTIQRVNAALTGYDTVTTFSTGSANSPREIAFAPGGSYYVVLATSAAVEHFSSTDTLLSTLPANGLSNAYGLTVGGDGTVYEVNQTSSGQIRRWDSSGNVLSAWTVPGTAFSAAYFSATPSSAPEPVSLLLLVAGLGGAGLRAARFRRRSPE